MEGEMIAGGKPYSDLEHIKWTLMDTLNGTYFEMNQVNEWKEE